MLGAGFGGLELTTRLSGELGDDIDIVLIDKADGFVFGFSKLDVMFGRTTAQAVQHSYRDLVKPGVRFVQTTIRSIDPAQRRVETDAGPFEADVMMVALGADLDPAATPGLVEAGREFYTTDGAFATHDVPAGPDPDSPLAGGIAGTACGVRGARDQLVPGAAGAQPGPGAPGGGPRRRRGNAVRPVPWCASPSGARGSGGVRDVCRRLDPSQPSHPRNCLPRCLRGRKWTAPR